jgi:hypothetical protein
MVVWRRRSVNVMKERWPKLRPVTASKKEVPV